MHRTTNRFWDLFGELPEAVQRSARRRFQLLKTDPAHPSLRFRRVGRLWSARVGQGYRALAIPDDGDFIWIWVGSHDEYMNMIRRMR